MSVLDLLHRRSPDPTTAEARVARAHPSGADRRAHRLGDDPPRAVAATAPV